MAEVSIKIANLVGLSPTTKQIITDADHASRKPDGETTTSEIQAYAQRLENAKNGFSADAQYASRLVEQILSSELPRFPASMQAKVLRDAWRLLEDKRPRDLPPTEKVMALGYTREESDVVIWMSEVLDSALLQFVVKGKALAQQIDSFTSDGETSSDDLAKIKSLLRPYFLGLPKLDPATAQSYFTDAFISQTAIEFAKSRTIAATRAIDIAAMAGLATPSKGQPFDVTALEKKISDKAQRDAQATINRHVTLGWHNTGAIANDFVSLLSGPNREYVERQLWTVLETSDGNDWIGRLAKEISVQSDNLPLTVRTREELRHAAEGHPVVGGAAGGDIGGDSLELDNTTDFDLIQRTEAQE